MAKTYRIEITEDTHNETWPWDATIYDNEDDYVKNCYGTTPEEAEANARQWIRDENRQAAQPRTLFVDETGNDVDAGHSVKA